MKRAIRAGERRYAGLLLHERRADRHARLVAAGLELYGTAGYGATTIPMLCSAAGVTSRHFYEEFGSREALLKELYDDIWRAVFDALRAALKDSAFTGADRIRRANQAYFRTVVDDPRRARIYALESMGVSTELERHRNAMREAFIKLVTPDQRIVLSPLDARLLSAAVVGAAQTLLLEWVQTVQKPDVDAMIETLTQIWLRTLKLPRED